MASIAKNEKKNKTALAKYSAPEIVHSGQGSEYRSEEHMELLETAGIKPSMSEKASPWQNGYKELFYSEFKLELGDPEACQNLGELTEAIAQHSILQLQADSHYLKMPAGSIRTKGNPN